MSCQSYWSLTEIIVQSISLLNFQVCLRQNLVQQLHISDHSKETCPWQQSISNFYSSVLKNKLTYGFTPINFSKPKKELVH